MLQPEDTVIALLMGGFSAEREVSLASGNAILPVLVDMGYKIKVIDVDRNVATVLKEIKPHLAFNALHGNFGEDGCIQGILEFLAIPYTHSGVLTSALAMNKFLTSNLLRQHGVPCLMDQMLTYQQLQGQLAEGSLHYPFVVKPVANGSSVDIYIVTAPHELPPENVFTAYQTMLVQPYVPGRELSVAVLNDDALGIVELCTKDGGFYDYTHKYTANKTDHILPAPIDSDLAEKILSVASKAHRILGCRGISRADFRYDERKEQFYLLEVNTQPGMTPLSLAPEIAAFCGIDFHRLLQLLIEDAACQK